MSCSDSYCSYSLSQFDKLKSYLCNVIDNFKRGYWKYWFLKKIVFKIVKTDDLSNCGKHLFDEIKYAGYSNEEKIEEIKGLTYIWGLLDRFGHSSSKEFRMVADCTRWKLYSPLKFTDEEFGDKFSIDGTKQNKRDSSVFKYGYNNFRDIDALGWKIKARYDISKEEPELEEYKWLGSHHGTCWLYDENDGSWMKVWSGQKIRMIRNFYGDKSYDIPCIEIYDSTDKKNDFFCYIANKSNIPEEFYEYFILTERNATPTKDDERELVYIKEHQLEHLLYKPVKKNIQIVDIIENDAKICVKVNWVSETEIVKEEFIKYGVAEKDIFIKYNDNDCSLIVPTNDLTREVVNKIKEQCGKK